jgi:glutamyl-tRNA(Gln) amidotransferase subunit D
MKDGDYVVVKTTSDELKGVLMPSKNTAKIVLKFDSGYNISLNRKDIKEIKTIPREKKEILIKKESISIKPGLKHVSILHTGGTFASKVDYNTGAVYTSFTPEELLKMFPEVRDLANIKSIFVRNMWSEDMNFNHYNLLAEEIKKEIESGSCDGIVITHGTDTIHYTSAALSFILHNLNIPVLIVGAQRSSDRGSSDAFLNLTSAINFIVKSDFIGVGICMHENLNDDNSIILPGLRSKKMHSSRRDAFKPINSRPIARVNMNRVEFLSEYKKKTKDSGKLELRLFNPKLKIGLLKMHPNMYSQELKVYNSFDGLIIEGTGLAGNFPINKIDEFTEENKLIYNSLKKLAKKIPVVATTQTIYGRVNMNVYSTGRLMKEIEILGDYSDLTSETSFIKLAWLLSNYSKEEVKKLYDTNIVGELNTRSQQDFF